MIYYFVHDYFHLADTSFTSCLYFTGGKGDPAPRIRLDDTKGEPGGVGQPGFRGMDGLSGLPGNV